jgi:hypothetical protein
MKKAIWFWIWIGCIAAVFLWTALDPRFGPAYSSSRYSKIVGLLCVFAGSAIALAIRGLALLIAKIIRRSA